MADDVISSPSPEVAMEVEAGDPITIVPAVPASAPAAGSMSGAAFLGQTVDPESSSSEVSGEEIEGLVSPETGVKIPDPEEKEP